MLTRRSLLKSLMLAGGFCLLPVGSRGWALAAPSEQSRHMVMIMMRGAVDGLSIVTPYTERNYYSARPTIALAPPGQTDGLLSLDSYFGLHPSLAPLMPLWQNQTMAFVHACGSPAETRSHFEAQDIMETALMNSAMATGGWMNGLAMALPDNHSSTRAVSFGNVLPKIFQGRVNIPTVPTTRGNKVAQAPNPEADKVFSQLYSGQSQLNGLYHEGVSAQQSISQDLEGGAAMQQEMQASSRGAPGTDAFVTECTKAADMIRRDPNVQLVFMDVGGWDTHIGQGNAKGQLANKLQRLGEGLAALAQNLGDQYQNTVIMVMSEFGRTVAQNGNGGTDHGHGNVAWLMGGGVRGGRVYSRWPGLNPNQLWEGRDLAVTTDFRSVIGAVAEGHFGLQQATIQGFIPNYQPDAGLSGIIT